MRKYPILDMQLMNDNLRAKAIWQHIQKQRKEKGSVTTAVNSFRTNSYTIFLK